MLHEPDSGWAGYPVWQTGQPASVGHPSYRVNVIKVKWKIIWTGGLLHLSGLPHLPGVHHLQINRSVDFSWGSHLACSLRESTVKWATQTYNLFSNVAAKLVEKRRYKFYYPHSNLSCYKSGRAGCENVLPKVESSTTFCSEICTCCAFYCPKVSKRDVT